MKGVAHCRPAQRPSVVGRADVEKECPEKEKHGREKKTRMGENGRGHTHEKVCESRNLWKILEKKLMIEKAKQKKR